MGYKPSFGFCNSAEGSYSTEKIFLAIFLNLMLKIVLASHFKELSQARIIACGAAHTIFELRIVEKSVTDISLVLRTLPKVVL